MDVGSRKLRLRVFARLAVPASFDSRLADSNAVTDFSKVARASPAPTASDITPNLFGSRFLLSRCTLSSSLTDDVSNKHSPR